MRIFIIFSVLIILLFTECKNEFEVNDDWKDITVIYGILNQADDTNYVKVTKCFLGYDDANIMAKVKDSLFYKNVDVVIEEWSNNILHNTIFLRDTTLIRHNDVFSDTTIVFYTTSLLSSDYTYKLKIEEGGKEVTAETPLLDDVNFIHGSSLMNLCEQFGREIEWYTKPNEKVFNLKLWFYYYEIYNDSTQKKDSIEIPITEKTSASIAGNEKMSIVISGLSFINSVGALIKDNPNVNHRIVADSCFKFCFLIGTEELYNYIQVSNSSLGIYSENPYTNINNGIGLFTSRLFYKLPYKYKATERTVNDISSSVYTQNLKFYNYSQTANIWSNYP
jgi:hypothetical protein